MDYLSRKLRDFASVFLTPPVKQEKVERQITRYEVYLEYIYKILSWEDNSLTLSAFLVLNFFFWLLVQWQVRLFGVIFFAVLIAFVWDFYFQTKNDDLFHSQYSDVFDEFYNFTYDVIFNLKSLRKESPSTFCIGMSITFLIMSFVARSMSGYMFLYLSLLGVFFLPLGLKYIPEEYLSWFRQILQNKVLAEEELIPYISEKDFNRMDPELDSLLTDRTADSVASLLSGAPSSMPSYLDVCDSRDGLEEDDLLPIRSNRSEFSTDSDSDHREMHFESAHFNGDSSSEEENLLVQGLKQVQDAMDNAKEASSSQEGFSNLLTSMASKGSSMVANVIKSAITHNPPQRKDSSSDSEFEIINSNDVEEKS